MKKTLQLFACLLGFQFAAGVLAAELEQDDLLVSQQATNETQSAVPSWEEASEMRQAIRSRYDENRVRKGAVVAIGKGASLSAGESAEAVVAIGGSARSDGVVREGVVAVGGNVLVNGDVGEAAVAVAGNAEINGTVADSVVAVLGNVRLGSNAIVLGDVVSVGGQVEMADGAVVRGQVQPVEFGFPGLPKFERLSTWVQQCVLKLRPLAVQVPWVWAVAGLFVLIYVLVAVAFPRPVAVCLEELTRRPATTFFAGLLVKILVPVVVLLLAATGIGLLVVPFVVAAAFFAAIVGKVAVLAFLGRAIGLPFGLKKNGSLLVPLMAGTVLMLVLYIIPIIGFMAYTLFGIWALGVAVTGAFQQISKEKPRTPPPSGAGPVTPPGPVPPAQAQAWASSSHPPGAPAYPPPQSPIAPPVQSRGLMASTLPRAGFWERMGAAFLDVALLTIPVALLGPFGLVLALAYFSGMWAWKGTTIGGVVLAHRVVREDGTPLTFLVALVRALGAAFSACILFLGFFWIGWDRDKQGWHDKIAGTCVVRLPRPMPLLCL